MALQSLKILTIRV